MFKDLQNLSLTSTRLTTQDLFLNLYIFLFGGYVTICMDPTLPYVTFCHYFFNQDLFDVLLFQKKQILLFW